MSTGGDKRPPRWRQIHTEILKVFTDRGIGTMVQLPELRAALPSGLGGQSDLPKRLRELREFGYRLPHDKKLGYSLTAAEPDVVKTDTTPISSRLATEVRLTANGRCQLCGKTVAEDGIKLVVDHRVPRTWGGATVRENLWALCEPCNISKRDYFDTFDPEIMSKCMGFTEALVRIGELLKLFPGELVQRKLLEVVGRGDDEWTRRLRELRELDWKIEQVHDGTAEGKYKYAYRLLESRPWPDDVGAALRAHRRAVKKRLHDDSEDA